MCEAAHTSFRDWQVIGGAGPRLRLREGGAMEGAMPIISFERELVEDRTRRPSSERRSEMKALRCCATTLALAAVISLLPAMAQGPKLSGGNAWPGVSQ